MIIDHQSPIRLYAQTNAADFISSRNVSTNTSETQISTHSKTTVTTPTIIITKTPEINNDSNVNMDTTDDKLPNDGTPITQPTSSPHTTTKSQVE